jgi:monoterpene epsilon-lactone hydrolase
MAALISIRDAGGPLPAAAVCLSGLLDLASTGGSIETNADVDPVGGRETFDMIAQAYLQGRCAPTEPLASPLYAELAGLPPLLLMVGTRDVLQDDSVRMAQRYRAAGNESRLVVEQDMVHIWPLFHRILPEGQAGVATIGAWVRAHT